MNGTEMTETTEITKPVFVNIQFLPRESELLASLDALALQGAMNRTTVAKQIVVRYLTGKITEADQPAGAGPVAANTESLLVTKLQNQLQNAISRHNREAESLREEIAKLKREKQQIVNRANQFGSAGLGDIDPSGRGGLAGAIEAKVSERMEKYELDRTIKDLSREVTDKTALIVKLEKEVATLEAENEELEDALEDAKEKLDADASIEKKLERYTAPALTGVATAFPALQGHIEGIVKRLSGVPGGGLGELPDGAQMSQEDRDGLEFVRDLRRKFSGEEQDMIVELMGHFHANKQLLKHNFHATQSIAKQQEESTDARDSGGGQ